MNVLKILTDCNISPGLEGWLEAQGHDLASVRRTDPKMADQDILAWAGSDGRIVFTFDLDFGELVFRKKLAHAGVLLLRNEGDDEQQKIDAVARILAQHAAELPGNFCVYQDGKLRVR